MAKITEIAPDLFRITTFVEPFKIQFSQFLMRDDQPLLFHTGPHALLSEVKTLIRRPYAGSGSAILSPTNVQSTGMTTTGSALGSCVQSGGAKRINCASGAGKMMDRWKGMTQYGLPVFAGRWMGCEPTQGRVLCRSA